MKKCEDCKYYIWRDSCCCAHPEYIYDVNPFDSCPEYEKKTFFDSEEFEIIFLLGLAILATIMVFECLF